MGLGATVFNTVVGSGIFILPAALAREAGASTPLAYIACAVIMGAVALCFAAAGSRVPASGGPVGYAEAAFGPLVGFLVGLLVWTGSALATAGIASALADAVLRMAPTLAGGPMRSLLIAGVLAGLAAVNLRGARQGAWLVEGVTVVKLLPLMLLLGAGGWVALKHPPSPQLLAGQPHLGRAMLLALFAFQGMEAALGVSGEVKDPARTIPRALLGAMAAVAALYISLQLVVQQLLGPALPGSSAPLVNAAERVWTPLGFVVALGMIGSFLGSLAGNVLSAPRTLYAFGGMGVLPRVFTRLGAKSRAPIAAILTHSLIAAALALSGGFVELAILASLTSVGVSLVGCAAAAVLQRRGVAQAGAALAVPGLWLAALTGCAGMIWLATNARPIELAGFAAVLVVGGLLYVARTRERHDAMTRDAPLQR